MSVDISGGVKTHHGAVSRPLVPGETRFQESGSLGAIFFNIEREKRSLVIDAKYDADSAFRTPDTFLGNHVDFSVGNRMLNHVGLGKGCVPVQHQRCEEADHAPNPTRVHIRYPDTSTTNTRLSGRKIFQPSRISWS